MTDPRPVGIRTAVLVDAENMVCGLGAFDPVVARVFAEHPGLWLDWLTGLTYPAVDGPGPLARRLLMRTCFLNSDTGRGLRPGFVRAGFDIVDCPSLTSAGKNAADIHLVIAMLDLLAHPTRYDEVILLSSDTDFTPALTRLRAHDRRTVVVASGPHTQVLAAACDHLIPADEFARALTALRPPGPTTARALPAVVTASSTPVEMKAAATSTTPAKKPATKKPATKKQATKKQATKKKQAAAKKSPAKKAAATNAAAVKKPTAKVSAPVDLAAAPDLASVASHADPARTTDDLAEARARAASTVVQVVASSPAPVHLSSLASPVRAALGPLHSPDYAGARGLKKLLQALDLPGLTVAGKGPGYIFDTARHHPPVVPGAD